MIGPYKESNKYKLECEIGALRARITVLESALRDVLELHEDEPDRPAVAWATRALAARDGEGEP